MLQFWGRRSIPRFDICPVVPRFCNGVLCFALRPAWSQIDQRPQMDQQILTALNDSCRYFLHYSMIWGSSVLDACFQSATTTRSDNQSLLHQSSSLKANQPNRPLLSLRRLDEDHLALRVKRKPKWFGTSPNRKSDWTALPHQTEINSVPPKSLASTWRMPRPIPLSKTILLSHIDTKLKNNWTIKMSEGISECCVSGHLHDGKPTGAVSEIVGLKTYIAAPENGSKDKMILFITDIFGYQLPVAPILRSSWPLECSNFGGWVCQGWILCLYPWFIRWLAHLTLKQY